MLARIHEAENSQYVAELTQKISQLEMKVLKKMSNPSNIQLIIN